MLIIGVTGGIACGKSAVVAEMKNFGAEVLNLDEVTHELLQPGGILFEIYVRHFGKKILDSSGFMDKKIVAEIIFRDRSERVWINSVAHPVLLNFTRDFLEKNSACGKKIVVLEVPLLFQAGWEILCDEVWAVTVSREEQISRLINRDKITREQAVAKINSQMPVEEICARADVVIENDKSLPELREKIFELMKSLI